MLKRTIKNKRFKAEPKALSNSSVQVIIKPILSDKKVFEGVYFRSVEGAISQAWHDFMKC